MATNEVDQKLITRLAQSAAISDPFLSSALFRILGLSIMLTGRLITARQLRKIDLPPDDKVSSFFQHILWLSREGLSITEEVILPYSYHYSSNEELEILGAKLRASFYHWICLFHNQPPIPSRDAPIQTSPLSSERTLSPIGPKMDQNLHYPRHRSPLAGSNVRKASDSAASGKESSAIPARIALLRDPIPSMNSEVSCITNPYATNSSLSPPPGFPIIPTGMRVPPPLLVPNAATFLCPARDYRPITQDFFNHAIALAGSLSASSPLRLSIAAEHAEFLAECVKDRPSSMRLARNTIVEVMQAETGMRDAEYEDAWLLMNSLYTMAEWKNEDVPPWAQYSGEARVIQMRSVSKGKLGSPVNLGNMNSPTLGLKHSRASGELTRQNKYEDCKR